MLFKKSISFKYLHIYIICVEEIIGGQGSVYVYLDKTFNNLYFIFTTGESVIKVKFFTFFVGTLDLFVYTLLVHCISGHRPSESWRLWTQRNSINSWRQLWIT